MVSAVIMTPRLMDPVGSPRPGAVIRTELDAAVVRRCQTGDREAFRLLVLHYQRPIFAFLYRTLGQDDEVEDLAQEVFLRAHRAIGRFDLAGPARMSSWLFTIAMHLVQDVRRRRAVTRRKAEPAEVSAGWTSATPETDEHRREIGCAVARAAAALPDDQRDVFVMAEYQQLATSEMATVLGVGENTVKTRLFRARERMRALLEPLWQEIGP